VLPSVRPSRSRVLVLSAWLQQHRAMFLERQSSSLATRILNAWHTPNKMGYETINIGEHDNLAEQIAQIVGEPVVDAAVDAVGFEAAGHGHPDEAAPAAVLNALMDITFVAGGVGIPGLYVVEDPGAPHEDSKRGVLKIRFGKGWYFNTTANSCRPFCTTVCPSPKSLMRPSSVSMTPPLVTRISTAEQPRSS
jgi:threonine dehydrogenase-like Zn-dependent dehydrogenase